MENDHINMQQGIECMIVICTSYIKNKMNVFEYGRRRISETLFFLLGLVKHFGTINIWQITIVE